MADKSASIFVKIDDYEELLNVFSIIKKNIADAKTQLNRIAELKAQEDIELENWYAEISDVESKIKFIDEALFELHK